jgi:hypothetical protein
MLGMVFVIITVCCSACVSFSHITAVLPSLLARFLHSYRPQKVPFQLVAIESPKEKVRIKGRKKRTGRRESKAEEAERQGKEQETAAAKEKVG